MSLLPEAKQTALSSKVEAEVEALLSVDPRVTFDVTPRRARIRRTDVWLMRALVMLGVAASIGLFYFLLAVATPGAGWLYWPLVAVFGFLILQSLYEWFCYLGVSARPEPPSHERPWTVDVLTTWCPGEPKNMVVATLKSIQRMPYPHTTYLCDEGDDPALREVCARLGVRHATRVEKVGAKAGNINSALRTATGDIAVIMDPDHEAAPYFLDRVMGYFDDPDVGFVQHVQAYYNQEESLIARGAAEQTYHFYGPLQTGMDGLGTVQAIGANCAFRRKALDSIGGHATGLAEDMATTLKLYAEGWTSVYSPEILTRGQVPTTFPGYSKQQLKWACGVWDILIESYPAAFRGISWVNRLHYVVNGLFYCRGAFFFMGALIPILALFTGLTPLEVTVEQFATWFGPYFVAHILVRQAAQRWLLEPEERGFHLIGGFLTNAVWLIHLRGVASALLRVKIPYIPTPKEDQASDAWSLAAPNFALVGLSLASIVYGLSWDWSPFAWVMAMFAAANVISLGTISVAAQQETVERLKPRVGTAAAAAALDRVGRALTDGLCWILRRMAAPIAVGAVAGLVWAGWPQDDETQLERLWAQMEGRTEKDTGGMLLGTYFNTLDESAYGNVPVAQAIDRVDELEASLGQNMPVVGFFYTWGDVFDAAAFDQNLAAIRDRGSVPMVTWMPSLIGFDKARTDPRYYNEESVFELVLSGELDGFIDHSARRFRDHGGPILLRFAHEMDNPQYPWSQVGGNTAEDFVVAWRYIVARFRLQGATNVSWVWSPWESENLGAYYPGAHYVDFVGLTLLNYGTTQGFGAWKSFDELYAPLHRQVGGYGKPIILAEFGSTDMGGDRIEWMSDALQKIASRLEIAGVVLFNQDTDTNWPASWTDAEDPFPLHWSVESISAELSSDLARFAEIRPPLPLDPSRSRDMAEPAPDLRVGRVGDQWTLSVDGAPFQIKGVAYASSSGWRSGTVATRNVVESDMAAIAAMGANTVRRYDISWADVNILRAAQANGLKVLMGVWLDPEVDYVGDPAALDQIEETVRGAVDRWQDHPAVLGWTIGNETWGQLKHFYTGPALVRQRTAYLEFVERLARIVKEIDPNSPVMTSLEFSVELPGAIVQTGRIAPSVDGFGVNAYYYGHLRFLDSMIETVAPARPVFLSEFGPPGYWDQAETQWSTEGFAVEPRDAEKAWYYEHVWREFVAGRSHSIGGVAFTYRDRLEGSPTWFGLTDTEGRKKPAYFALASVWKGDAESAQAGLPKGLTLKLPDLAAPGSTVTPVLEGSGWGDTCSVDWQMVDEMTLETVWQAHVGTCSVQEASSGITLPPTPGRYRLIVRVAIEGAVTTASHPILLVDRSRKARLP